MKYGENDIYQIIDLYNYYLSSEFSFEEEIELIPDSYHIEDVKFHKWKIQPLYINESIFTHIKLSDSTLDEILYSLNTMKIDKVLVLNKGIIKNSLK